MARDTTGLLIIRARVEPGSSAALRAEIRLTSDVSAGMVRTVNLADVDLVTELVRTWLNSIVED